MVSTHLKNISQIGNLPQIGVKIKKYLKPPPRKRWNGKTILFLVQKCLAKLGFERNLTKLMCFTWQDSLAVNFLAGFLNHQRKRFGSTVTRRLAVEPIFCKLSIENSLNIASVITNLMEGNFYNNLAGGFQPIYKILVKLDHFPNIRMNI